MATSEKIPAKDVAAVKKCEASYNKIRDELSKVIVGQDEVIEHVLISMFARGHALLAVSYTHLTLPTKA